MKSLTGLASTVTIQTIRSNTPSAVTIHTALSGIVIGRNEGDLGGPERVPIAV
jgi:ribosomal protein S3